MAIIEVNGLAKRYGSKRGINDVSFTVGEGEIFGFLGPNGAGKTTTLRILMALLRADAGSARIADMDSWQESLAIKRIVGYVPGEPALDPSMTGGQVLAYYANLRGGVDRGYLTQLIERLDLDPTRKVRQYSTGNKRKVVLIQAFMHRPKILILDEPTSGLDPINQQEFNRMIIEAREAGSTVLLSSHVLSEVEHTCARVAIIRAGSLVRVGEVAELKDIKRHELAITFAGPAPAESFRNLPDVESVEASPDGRTLRVTAAGELDGIVKAAARHSVVNLTSQEPSLEEVFLKYYEGGEHAEEEDVVQ